MFLNFNNTVVSFDVLLALWFLSILSTEYLKYYNHINYSTLLFGRLPTENLQINWSQIAGILFKSEPLQISQSFYILNWAGQENMQVANILSKCYLEAVWWRADRESVIPSSGPSCVASHSFATFGAGHHFLSVKSYLNGKISKVPLYGNVHSSNIYNSQKVKRSQMSVNRWKEKTKGGNSIQWNLIWQ